MNKKTSTHEDAEPANRPRPPEVRPPSIADSQIRIAEAMDRIGKVSVMLDECCIRLVGHAPGSREGSGKGDGSAPSNPSLQLVMQMQAESIERQAARLEDASEMIFIAVK